MQRLAKLSGFNGRPSGGLVQRSLGDLDPDLTYDINHGATVHLAKLARQAAVPRFLFSSSCSNYGASGDGLLDENAPFNPVTPYGVSKVRAEQDLLALATDEFSPVLLRSATAYGVSPWLRCDIVLNNLTAWAVATGKVRIKSDGTPWRPIVHVEDICRAFAAALTAPRVAIHKQAFNVGRPEENYRFANWRRSSTRPSQAAPLSSPVGPDARNYRVDCSKIARALPDLKPRWTAREGAREARLAHRSPDLRRSRAKLELRALPHCRWGEPRQVAPSRRQRNLPLLFFRKLCPALRAAPGLQAAASEHRPMPVCGRSFLSSAPNNRLVDQSIAGKRMAREIFRLVGFCYRGFAFAGGAQA